MALPHRSSLRLVYRNYSGDRYNCRSATGTTTFGDRKGTGSNQFPNSQLSFEGPSRNLNEVGARVWSLVQEPRNVSEIRDAILEEFDVDPSLCERDLLVLLRDLAGRALIKVKDETAA